MTPADLIGELRRLRARRFLEMVDLTVRILPDVRRQMTLDRSIPLRELVHVAQMAVDLEEWNAANRKVEAEAQASRPS